LVAHVGGELFTDFGQWLAEHLFNFLACAQVRYKVVYAAFYGLLYLCLCDLYGVEVGLVQE
jgi:hypothetical protein